MCDKKELGVFIMHEDCTRVGELTKAEVNIILSHLERHKWFRHIENEDEAIISFNDEFGPILRDMYCRFACPDRADCKLMLDKLEKDEDGFDGDKEAFKAPKDLTSDE